jgi:hypothetical protein
MTATSPSPPASPSKPESTYPKQAIVVIHGMGEQRPMDTIRGFVRAAWELDPEITANGLPDPAEVWSKPDVRTGSLELRRITTRQSIASKTFPSGIRSDFYELYWADLSGGSTWDQVKAWIFGLLLRNPFTRVPKDVFLAWLVLWALTLIVIFFAIATALPADTSVFGIKPWDYPPLAWVAHWPRALLGAVTAAFAFLEHSFVVPYFGRVECYTRATPDNIAARKNIRERGLLLLSELHKSDYDRIIVVGHSLGSILAYDLVSYFWASRYDPRTVIEGTPEFDAVKTLEQVLSDWAAAGDDAARAKCQAAFLQAQDNYAQLLRARPKPAKDAADPRWLITDLVTLGSPLSHAEFLLAHDAAELKQHQDDRGLPRCPPVRELLDPDGIAKARAAGFALGTPPQLMCFPFGSKGQWQLHYAAPFAAVRWTNIHDPAILVMCGDLVSGPVAPVFGPGVIDIDLRQLRGQSWRFSHTRYWATDGNDKPLVALRTALDLAFRKQG